MSDNLEAQEAQMLEDEKELLPESATDADNLLTHLSELGESRRQFLGQVSVAGLSVFAVQLLAEQEALAFSTPMENTALEANNAAAPDAMTVKLKINGAEQSVAIEPRVTLLDALRERLNLTGTKKGCDHGQCGACTVLVNGRRTLSCLTLAAMSDGHEITTIEGLAKGEELHPMQAAFIKHDGFQCGYCTPGQICSAVALLTEAKNGEASYVTTNLRTGAKSLQLSDDEIRERMSGNICRCGAYPNIVAAIREVHTGKEVAQNWNFAEKEQNDETV
ncbi:MAG: 2Fe-2S iron-sulfur cluster-binding protein [Pyrinomonadaceae bacterium]